MLHPTHHKIRTAIPLRQMTASAHPSAEQMAPSMSNMPVKGTCDTTGFNLFHTAFFIFVGREMLGM